MSTFVLLDYGLLGMLTNPKATPLCEECRLWFSSLVSKNYQVILPEITDYEVRRGLRKQLNNIIYSDNILNCYIQA